MPSRGSVRRGGFTLLETIAALALAGIVLAGGYGLLQQLGDSRERLHLAGEQNTGRANDERLLAELIAHAAVAQDSTASFSGAAGHAAFTSWCVVPDGWLERCAVTLELRLARDSSTLSARRDGSQALSLPVADSASLAYFAAGRGWTSEWPGGLTAPAALGLVAGRDTMVFPLGAAR